LPETIGTELYFCHW